ncbi:MAG: biotin--[acetyl-CoA-carboxylase] ligase [Ardenticatenia bacterium]|nr:biotin--[acetyl-CoA-carboxylase] ligase [Ardenticatenia bacterium]
MIPAREESVFHRRPVRRLDLEARLAGHTFGRPLYWAEVVDSTNRVLLEWAARGATEGLTLVADHQTAGRGRRGRPWVAPPRTALLMSVVLHPARHATSLIPLLTGVAVADVLADMAGLTAELKWPNDVLVRGRKVAGILAEAVTVGDRVSVVVGVGINMRVPRSTLDALPLAATSVALETDRCPSRQALLLALLSRWEAHYQQLQQGRWTLDLWRARAPMLGRPITVVAGDTTWSGTAIDVAPDGALLVRRPDGHVEALYAADVTVR